MKKIKEKQDRKKLGEGRNFGIGFSILKKNSASDFETLNAFTACKDYLNDFSYVEYKKKEIGSVHGYDHKLSNCFDNKKIFHLGVNTLHYNYANQLWGPKEECTKLLIKNYKNVYSLFFYTNNVNTFLKFLFHVAIY